MNLENVLQFGTHQIAEYIEDMPIQELEEFLDIYLDKIPGNTIKGLTREQLQIIKLSEDTRQKNWEDCLKAYKNFYDRTRNLYDVEEMLKTLLTENTDSNHDIETCDICKYKEWRYMYKHAPNESYYQYFKNTQKKTQK